MDCTPIQHSKIPRNFGVLHSRSGTPQCTVREDVWLHKTDMECTLYRRRAGSPSPPLLPIIGAWLLAYFFKGALIRGPLAIWRAAHLNFTSEGLGALPARLPDCLRVLALARPSLPGLPGLHRRPPTATASRPICKSDCLCFIQTSRQPRPPKRLQRCRCSLLGNG